MSVEADIFDTLKGLVSNKVFPDVAPFSTTTPLIVYMQMGGKVLQPIANVVPDKQNGTFRINAWSDTRAQAAALALSIEAALIESTKFIARPLSAPVALNDPDLKRYGTSQDFSIWSSRS